MVDNAKIENIKCDILGDFQTMCLSLLSTENQSWIWWQNIASHWMASNIPHLCFHPHSVWNSHKNVSIEELCQNETCLGIFIPYEIYPHCVWKSSIMSHLNFSIMAFSINFCPIISDLSGNTVWPQTSGFSKTRQNWLFLAFLMHFCPLKNINLARFARNTEFDFFLWFSNTVK